MAFRNPVTRLSQLVADSITGATINGGTIIGAVIKTLSGGTITGTSIFGSLFSTGQSASDTNPRIEIHDNKHGNDIEFHSSAPMETTPARIYSTGDASTVGALRLDSGYAGSNDPTYSYVAVNEGGPVVVDAYDNVDLLTRVGIISAQGALRIGATYVPTPGMQPVQPGGTINAFNFGYASGTADSNGRLTVSHSLNAIPNAVALGHNGPAGDIPRIVSGTLTASTFQIEFNTSSGAAVAKGTSCSAYWIAVT